MERVEKSESSIDLGDIAATTKGPWGHYTDDVLMQEMAGLTDD